jgi:hypothetical protein
MEMLHEEIKEAIGGALGPPAEAPPAEPAVPASRGARLVAYALLAVGLVLAIFVKGKGAAFMPKEGFVLFTGFYVAAQAIERVLEIVLPPGAGTAQGKADRSLVMSGIAFVLGIGASLALGLRFLTAVEVGSPPRWLDVFITGLVIAGGTKPLHDLIGTIEKAKG